MQRNSPANMNLRFEYCTEIYIINRLNLIFLDETGFNEHVERSYGYSGTNVSAYKYVPGNRGINRSCMAVIGMNGVICYQYHIGAYNSSLFTDFINEKLVTYFRENPEKILIMDNLNMHKANIVATALRNNGISFKFFHTHRS